MGEYQCNVEQWVERRQASRVAAAWAWETFQLYLEKIKTCALHSGLPLQDLTLEACDKLQELLGHFKCQAAQSPTAIGTAQHTSHLL